MTKTGQPACFEFWRENETRWITSYSNGNFTTLKTSVAEMNKIIRINASNDLFFL